MKFKNTVLTVLILIIFLLSFNGICAEANETVEIVNNDTSIIPQNQTSDFTYVNQAYEEFTNDLKNTNLETVYLNNDINITKSIVLKRAVTVDGMNHTINAQSLTGIFSTKYALTLKNIILINANTTKGGAIYSSGGNLVISNCQFMDNHASSYGGAVHVTGGNVTVTNSQFNDNWASSYGGALFVKNANLQIKNSIFSENNAGLNNTTAYGGAIYTNACNVVISNCQFIRNQVTTYGGALFIRNGNLQVKNSIFTRNNAGFNNTASYGGAVYCAGNNVVITNSQFTQNQATVYGGALFIKNGYLQIKNSNFTKNHIESNKTTGRGGALYIQNSSSKITYCIFKSNICNSTLLDTHSNAVNYHYNGGAIYYYSGSSQILSYCNFTGNKASNHGGSIFTNSGVASLKINRCRFTTNTAVFEDGGAISFAGVLLTLTNSIFKNNLAYEDGGAIDTFSLNNKNVNIIIKKCTFTSNTAYKGAGAIWLGVKTVSTITGTVFNKNKASQAGAVYTEDGKATISKCNFSANSAGKITSWVVKSKAGKVLNFCGGAIFNHYCKSLKITNCVFKKNTATFGGALHYQKGKLTFLKNTIKKCTAKNAAFIYASANLTVSKNNNWGIKKITTKKALKNKLINKLIKIK